MIRARSFLKSPMQHWQLAALAAMAEIAALLLAYTRRRRPSRFSEAPTTSRARLGGVIGCEDEPPRFLYHAPASF